MRIFPDVQSMRAFSRQQRLQGRSVALVPTMGCLHEGHLSLIRAAKKSSDVIIVSIYVNPTQFSVTEDFGRYPRQREEDHSLLQRLEVDATFEPVTLYQNANQGEASSLAGANGHVPGDHETYVQVEHLQQGLCGLSRPHFFRGVATVVIKLFHIVEPDCAWFGQKDFQQLLVIKRMVRDLDMAVKVESVPIMREADGLAMSSRNKLLSRESRSAALAIPEALQWARQQASGEPSPAALRAGIAERLEQAGGKVDYVEVVDGQSLQPANQIDSSTVIAVATYFGRVRLIDNISFA